MEGLLPTCNLWLGQTLAPTHGNFPDPPPACSPAQSCLPSYSSCPARSPSPSPGPVSYTTSSSAPPPPDPLLAGTLVMAILCEQEAKLNPGLMAVLLTL